MVKAKVWLLVRRPDGLPVPQDFKLIEEDLPPCGDGDIIIEAEFYSVDPYQRYKAREIPLNGPMYGSQVAKVIESKNPSWKVGFYLVCYPGWRSHTHITAKELKEGGVVAYTPLPDTAPLPRSVALGVLGMPGNTAYFGFLELCEPKPGDTVLVNAAAGAVGSAVVQIAKIKGCKVIASAGTEEKCKWVKELGADYVFNYKTSKIGDEIKKAAPNGINCYFDNVAGDFTLEALPHMATKGRISLCGAISSYHEDRSKLVARSPYDPAIIISRSLRLEGFMVPNWASRWMEGIKQLKEWLVQGKLKYKETVEEGFENIPKAFIGLFTGDNTGKAIVKA
ncbi:prostaglandin reductase 1-like [Macrobrachium rosenbergii]|uniref:prostaglandin reductase 1-like n=1 Tax=Macrobrachium rosenbergii TaxID=79674 RepID=UPI0034D4D7F3